jgi:hypothetical protein
MKKDEDYYKPGSLARIYMVDNFHIVATYPGLHSNVFITKNELQGQICLITGKSEHSKNWGHMFEVLVQGEIIFLRKENLQMLCKD